MAGNAKARWWLVKCWCQSEVWWKCSPVGKARERVVYEKRERERGRLTTVKCPAARPGA